MNIQLKALQIIYDIAGIILKWDKQQFTDKEAMQEIVKTLSSEVENDEKFYDIKKKFYIFRIKKSFLTPLAITAVFFAVLFVANPFATDDRNIIAENTEIRFEQLNQIPYNIDEILKNSVLEEFSNQTISDQN
jgi:RecA-family ATPase